MSKIDIHCIGNAHLDPAWMWQIGEGIEAFIATCRSAIERINETDEFIFTCSSAAHYNWIEQIDIKLFESIKLNILKGKWNVAGGWWVQSDCNIPSGEGLVRESLLGQRYFHEKFGITSKVGYSPDSFGHSLGLVQLLVKSGMFGYMFCRPDPFELTLQSPIFNWKNNENEILAYRIPLHYNMYQTTIENKIKDIESIFFNKNMLFDDVIKNQILKSIKFQIAIFYGVGNHGGGPTKEHISDLKKIRNEYKNINIIFSNPEKYLSKILPYKRNLPFWNLDLQLNSPGCYSVHSLIKKLNRTSEYLLLSSEKWGVVSELLTNENYSNSQIKLAWQDVCFNHFHDLLCGVAIKPALNDAINQYGRAITIGNEIQRISIQRIASRIDTTDEGQTLIVFNPHSYELNELIKFELWHDVSKDLWKIPVKIVIKDSFDNIINHQLSIPYGKIGNDRIAAVFKAKIPPLGWSCFKVIYIEQNDFNITSLINENKYNLDEIFKIKSKLNHINYEYEIVDDYTDTWGHGVEKYDKVIGNAELVKEELIECGELFSKIRRVYKYNNSIITEEFTINEYDNDIELSVKVNWNEKNKLLRFKYISKYNFEHSISENQYNNIKKIADGTERPMGIFCGGIFAEDSVFILNDCKHSFSCIANSLYVTILRSPLYSHHDPHIYSSQEPEDYIDQGESEFKIKILINKKLDYVYKKAYLLNQNYTTHFESNHAGSKELNMFSALEISIENVVAIAFKKSEDGEGYIIRLFETIGLECECEIKFLLLNTYYKTIFKKNEIKTLKIYDEKIIEVLTTEFSI